MHQSEDPDDANDLQTIDVLKWPMKASGEGSLDFWVATMANFVDVVKKFMIEGKDGHVNALFRKYLDMYVNVNKFMKEARKMVGTVLDENFQVDVGKLLGQVSANYDRQKSAK